jgi:hypothetical protein
MPRRYDHLYLSGFVATVGGSPLAAAAGRVLMFHATRRSAAKLRAGL